MLSLILATALALQAVPVSTGEPAPLDMPPTPEQVLAIPEELQRDFRIAVLDVTRSPEQRLRLLSEFMFDKKGLGLRYAPGATRTITEAYRTRTVNCLSFTLLAVALAREANLRAYGQQMDRILEWGVRGDIVMQTMHANTVVTIRGTRYVIDIAAYALSAPVADFQVDDEHLLALFYGNRAMELLTTGHVRDAQAWLDVALAHSPDDATLLNNAGVMNMRTGDPAAAETFYLRALAKDPKLMSGFSNLISLYRGKGEITKAEYWQKRATNALRKDPYHQFSLGRQQEQSGDYAEAASLYRRAIKLNGGEPLFHLGLSRAYEQLGQSRLAGLEMSRALDLSGSEGVNRYQAKWQPVLMRY